MALTSHVRNILDEAEKFTLAARVAAKMKLENWTYELLVKQKADFVWLKEPTYLAIVSAMRDIEMNRYKKKDLDRLMVLGRLLS